MSIDNRVFHTRLTGRETSMLRDCVDAYLDWDEDAGEELIALRAKLQAIIDLLQHEEAAGTDRLPV